MEYRENYRIRSSECDEKDVIRLAALWDIMQDAANEHSRKLNMAFEDMHAKGVAWALIRMDVKVVRYPKYGETIEVVTYPAGYNKLYAVRQYRVLDAAGKEIAFANSAWIVMDVKSRRPQRVSKNFNEIFSKEYTGELCPKLDAATGLVRRRDITAEYSDIDANGHVNNARYINWVENEFPGQKISYINVNYISEIKLGSNIELWQNNGDVEFHDKEGKTLFRSKIFLDYANGM